MIVTRVRRGLVAGLLGGLFAALLALAVAEPQLGAAIAWEEAEAAPADDDGETFSRPVQKAGMVGGMAVTGLAVGALFGVAACWAVGRVAGDEWQRSVKMGATIIGAVVLLPALRYPPNPPGVGDPGAVAMRSALYLGLAGFGLLLAGVAWAGARVLGRTALDRPVRQMIVAAGVAAAAVAVVLALPAVGDAGVFPAELLWRFRLSSIATQVALFGGIAVAFGLLSARADGRRERSVETVP